MRKISTLLGVLIVAASVAVTAPVEARHKASHSCSGGVVPGIVKITADSVTACADGVGSLTVAQTEDGGYLVADADAESATIHACLDGFVGVQVHDGTPSVVFTTEGDYAYPHSPEDNNNPQECVPQP